MKTILCMSVALLLTAGSAVAKDLNSVGVSVATLGNPFFTTIGRGVEGAVKKINPNAKVSVLSADYDIGKQSAQIDSFIAAKTDLILLDVVDREAIAPAIERAKAAGVVVVGVDEASPGEQAVVMTDNVEGGRLACQLLAEKLGGKGNILIINGPQVSSVVGRVKGCNEALAKHPEMKILSQDQDAKGSRDGGLAVTQALLIRFPKVDGMYAINDPTAIGASLALRQMNRTDAVIVGSDGSPDGVAALKDPSSRIIGTASQDPYAMAARGVELGYQLLQGKAIEKNIEYLPPKLITPADLDTYVGWEDPR